MTVHHGHRLLNGGIVGEFGVVLQDVRSHSVWKRLDDTWNDEEQSPKEGVDVLQGCGAEDALPVAFVAIEETTVSHVFLADESQEIDIEAPHQGQADKKPYQWKDTAHLRLEQSREDVRTNTDDDQINHGGNDAFVPVAFQWGKGPVFVNTKWFHITIIIRINYSMTTVVHPCLSSTVPYWMPRSVS